MHISVTNPSVILTTLMFLITHSEQSVHRTRRSHEPVDSVECVTGKGQQYRGTVSTTITGRQCKNWNSVLDVYSTAYYGKGLGPHAYCRNPDDSASPWCWVQEQERESCYITPCNTPKLTPQRDTEFTCGERKVNRLNKIVGGSYTLISSHPWVASIFNKRARFLCGGSLIAPCWVLTAAHCFNDVRNKTQLSVYLGKNAIHETDDTKEQGPFMVKDLIPHESFDFVHVGRDFNNDIALLRIEGPGGECAVRTETVRTVCLPPAYTRLPPGSLCTIAGYGHDHTRISTKYLKEGQVRLRPQEQCKMEAPEPEKVTDNMFCAASGDWTTDACQSDSGGPLVCEVHGRMFLFGIISFGEDCAVNGKPGFYTRVTNYNKWISRQADLHPYTQGAMYPRKW